MSSEGKQYQRVWRQVWRKYNEAQVKKHDPCDKRRITRRETLAFAYQSHAIGALLSSQHYKEFLR